MKRFLITILCLISVLCGCGSEKKVTLKTDLLSFGCNVDYNGDKYSFDVTTLKNGDMDCVVTAPQTLEGMKFVVNDKQIKTDYMGIKVEKKLSEIPFGSAISLFYAVMEDAKGKTLTKKDGDYCLVGKVNGLDYTLKATEEGLPVSINSESKKIILEFVKLTLVND